MRDIRNPYSTAETDQSVEPVKKNGFIHRLYTSDFNIGFVDKRRTWYAISGVLLAACLLSIFVFRGLSWGIEFVGGAKFQVPASNITETTIGDYMEVVQGTGLEDLGTEITTTSEAIRIQVRELNSDEVDIVRAALAEKAGIQETDIAYQLIGPSWGEQITQKGIIAFFVFVGLVALLIALYFRDWKISVAALAALFHDLIITVGVYSIVGFAVTPATITGVLTILGYSLYDTVVVFDKVKENTKDIERQDFTYSQRAQLAGNQVFVRSINTTVVGVLPVLAILVAGMWWLGGEGPLPDLGLAMAAGMIAGAWSSPFVAIPLLCQLKELEPGMKAHRAALEHRRARARKDGAVVAPTADTSLVTVSIPTLAAATLSKPVVDTVAAGRPQPQRAPRSQRKKA
ncbi:MAG: protein translocase subunit SecF [Propionibacteriaceae bacterium]|jgi:preprotein translocase subunit SecF|nr:protein translocase subunit SecF [Propionibacteriaceae bacterium]